MLFTTLHQFKRIDSTIASSALKKLQLHLWYLTEEMVPVCLFDGCVADEQKKIAETMLQKKSIMLQSPKKIRKWKAEVFRSSKRRVITG